MFHALAKSKGLPSSATKKASRRPDALKREDPNGGRRDKGRGYWRGIVNVLGSPMGDQDDVPFEALIESEGGTGI